jgi:hypothetical protein
MSFPTDPAARSLLAAARRYARQKTVGAVMAQPKHPDKHLLATLSRDAYDSTSLAFEALDLRPIGERTKNRRRSRSEADQGQQKLERQRDGLPGHKTSEM